jgi:hypothetical protein
LSRAKERASHQLKDAAAITGLHRYGDLGAEQTTAKVRRVLVSAAAEALPHVRDIASALLSMRSPALRASR